jgi:hypothetical protein
MGKRQFINQYSGEFARTPKQKSKINRLIKRKMFLFEVASKYPDVLRSLYEQVLIPHRKLFPLPGKIFDSIYEAFEAKVLEVWDEQNQGELLSRLGNAISANQTQEAKALAYHREYAAYKHSASLGEEWFLWQGLEIIGSDFSDLIALREAVRKWLQQWNLESDFFGHVAISTMHDWALDDESEFNQWNGFGGGGGQVDINEEEELALLPTKLISRWYPFQQRLKDYLEEVRNQLRATIMKDPLGSLACDGYLKSHLKDFIDLLIEHLKVTYCNKLAEYYESKGFERFSKKTRADEHTKWTVKVRVLCQSDDDVVQAFKTIAKENNLKVNAVKKAVRQYLVAMGLPLQPTFKSRGRPKK